MKCLLFVHLPRISSLLSFSSKIFPLLVDAIYIQYLSQMINAKSESFFNIAFSNCVSHLQSRNDLYNRGQLENFENKKNITLDIFFVK